MKWLRWLEQKLFTGEVLHDFGPLYEQREGTMKETHTLLLCRHRGEEVIVIRHSHRALLAFSVSYTSFPADLAASLAEKFVEIAERRHAGEARS